MSIFKDKTLLISGGTGSFGNAVLKRFLRTDIGEIRIFSRDEKKQDDMRHEYQAKYPDVAHKIKFYIGDVRSLESCRSAIPGTDFIFHAAALKQVPSCEFFLLETDIYVLPIDNYVDITKANKIIATSKPVILLFSKYHDEDNTIPAELKEVEALKNEKVPNCVKATYNGNRDRIMIGERYFAEIQFATLHV